MIFKVRKHTFTDFKLMYCFLQIQTQNYQEFLLNNDAHAQ